MVHSQSHDPIIEDMTRNTPTRVVNVVTEYSTETCAALRERFQQQRLHRPLRVGHYDPGTELVYDIDPLDGRAPGNPVRVHLQVEKFVGGGFAGQVYRVRVLAVESGQLAGVAVGGVYALKILIPPSGFSLLFRNLLYAVGFQAPFQLQTNPTAARAGALWQKFIRRAATERFGDERAVNDILGTFVDHTLGSCGELSNWVDGRTWRLEVDERMDLLRSWNRGRTVDTRQLGSPEFRAKKQFMKEFVELLHEVGAPEFARQYEWSTWKSQPNCLKRLDTEDEPSRGLVAVDFRAGLALLPFLPMSPGDVILIGKGLARGSLVQFDRGDLDRLEAYVNVRPELFADMTGMLTELKAAERVYRDSMPDITHNHLRLLYSGKLWSTILSSAVTGWFVRGDLDPQHRDILRGSRSRTLLMLLVSLLPLLGGFVRRCWGNAAWRNHFAGILTSPAYLKRAVSGVMAEKAIAWYRDDRITESDATRTASSPGRFLVHLPLSLLPVGLHKFLTDRAYFKERLDYIFVRPFRLYFRADEREQWLREMVAEGRQKRIIQEDDARTITSQINETFIQKYLKSLAVHILTVPITQVISVLIAVAYVVSHPEMPRAQAWGIGLGIIALFQVIPISPGSLVRGLYVVFLVIRERNFKDYNIAVFLGFFKYIGYLAFPIQMTYRYPTLARFMAAHWATEAVHVVPVFGEQGALLEHWVFRLFYNWPLTIRRRMRLRAEWRARLQSRYWHAVLVSVIGASLLLAADQIYWTQVGGLPGLKDIWWLVALLPLMSGVAVTLGCGGATLPKRVVAATLCGVAMGILYPAGSALLSAAGVSGAAEVLVTSKVVIKAAWSVFLFGILAALGAIVTELNLPEPDQQDA